MVLLITPNTKKLNYGLTSNEYSAIQPNVYMHMLEACFNKVHRVSCSSINMEADGYDIDSLITYISKNKPHSIGIICSGSNPSASTMTMPGAIVISKAIRKHFPKQHIFLWGGHPSVLRKRSLKETEADDILTGGFNIDVSRIPQVDWLKINPAKYRAHNWHCFGNLEDRTPYAVVWTSLGCPYTCEFCCINNIYGKRTYMLRDVDKVIAEIDELYKLGVKNIKVMDELFVSKNHRRIEAICDKLIERNYDLNLWAFARVDTVTPRILIKLRRAGFKWLAYGFETVHEDSLNGQKKGVSLNDYAKVIRWTKEAGISIIADFIAGFWEDNIQRLEELYDFMCYHNFEFINLYPLFAYPGTRLYDSYIEKSIITVPEQWSEYSLYGSECKPCPTRYLSSSDVLKWRDDRYVSYYQRSEYLAMIENKFGIDTRRHVANMSNMKLERNICQ